MLWNGQLESHPGKVMALAMELETTGSGRVRSSGVAVLAGMCGINRCLSGEGGRGAGERRGYWPIKEMEVGVQYIRAGRNNSSPMPDMFLVPAPYVSDTSTVLSSRPDKNKYGMRTLRDLAASPVGAGHCC